MSIDDVNTIISLEVKIYFIAALFPSLWCCNSMLWVKVPCKSQDFRCTRRQQTRKTLQTLRLASDKREKTFTSHTEWISESWHLICRQWQENLRCSACSIDTLETCQVFTEGEESDWKASLTKKKLGRNRLLENNAVIMSSYLLWTVSECFSLN